MTARRHFPHDMGGQKGSAVIPDAETAPVFKEEWQARALAITVLSGALGKWNIDESRHIREALPEDDYKTFSYYEKWLSGLAGLLVRHGLVSRDELKKGTAAEHPMLEKTLPADRVRTALDKGASSARDISTPPKYAVGDQITTRNPAETARVENGHTRLPQYAAGKQGVITAYHGGHVLPDSNAHGLGECPEHLYAVQFRATDLWDNADRRDHVIVDCWESYLR
jgi:nitrile hydratase